MYGKILAHVDKNYTTKYSYFSTSTFVKLFLLINFYFSSTLLHYPIFLLLLDELIEVRITNRPGSPVEFCLKKGQPRKNLYKIIYG